MSDSNLSSPVPLVSPHITGPSLVEASSQGPQSQEIRDQGPQGQLTPTSKLKQRLQIDSENFKIDDIQYDPKTGRPMRNRRPAKRLNIVKYSKNPKDKYEEEVVEIDTTKYDKMLKEAILESETPEERKERELEMQQDDEQIDMFEKEIEENSEYEPEEDDAESSDSDESIESEVDSEYEEEMSDESSEDEDYQPKGPKLSKKRKLLDDEEADDDDSDFLDDDDDNPEWLDYYAKMPQPKKIDEVEDYSDDDDKVETLE